MGWTLQLAGAQVHSELRHPTVPVLEDRRLHTDVWERLLRSSLYLDQTDTRLEVDRGQVERFYLPLATELLSMAERTPRLLVAVAGPPGSGKTAFATLLVCVINAVSADEPAVLVGLDGWHYPNGYLEAQFIERDGQRISLRQIKGAPETFDAAAVNEWLSRIRSEEQLSFPVYSRRLHEPMPDAGTVCPWHRIVVVEGNYLLLDEGIWTKLRHMFDLRVFISARTETLLEGLRERQRRGGKSPEAVEQWLRAVDVPNICRVAPGAADAQVLVQKRDVRNIDCVQWV